MGSEWGGWSESQLLRMHSWCLAVEENVACM